MKYAKWFFRSVFLLIFSPFLIIAAIGCLVIPPFYKHVFLRLLALFQWLVISFFEFVEWLLERLREFWNWVWSDEKPTKKEPP